MFQSLRSILSMQRLLMTLFLMGASLYIIFLTGKVKKTSPTKSLQNLVDKDGLISCKGKNSSDYPTIYFLETSGKSSLNYRQACSIESASRTNPLNNVTIFLIGPNPPVFNPWMVTILKLNNVQLKYRRLEEMFLDSPLQNWFQEGLWHSSPHKVYHLSDALRLAVICKYGGIYLDLDMNVLHPVSNCLQDALVQEHSTSVTNAIFGFQKCNTFLYQCLMDFESNYDPHLFAYNGPNLITRNFLKYCNEKHCDVTLLPSTAAFPIPYENWPSLFRQTSETNVKEYFNQSIAVHIFNKVSSNKPVPAGSLYDLLMKTTCPSIYRMVRNVYVDTQV